MEQKNNIAILILGDAEADKTTIQRIIGQALQDAGVNYTLGADSQRENNLLGAHQYDQEAAALHLNNTTTVVMEPITVNQGYNLKKFIEAQGENTLTLEQTIVIMDAIENSGGINLEISADKADE